MRARHVDVAVRSSATPPGPASAPEYRGAHVDQKDGGSRRGCRQRRDPRNRRGDATFFKSGRRRSRRMVNCQFSVSQSRLIGPDAAGRSSTQVPRGAESIRAPTQAVSARWGAPEEQRPPPFGAPARSSESPFLHRRKYRKCCADRRSAARGRRSCRHATASVGRLA